jgi:hypothetical protein
MQNPEGWDDYVGNPQGTARAGLLQLIPTLQLPPAGSVGTGPVTVSPTINTPPGGTMSTTITAPALPNASGYYMLPPRTYDDGRNDVLKTLALVGLGAGLVVGAWWMLKGRTMNPALQGQLGLVAGGQQIPLSALSSLSMLTQPQTAAPKLRVLESLVANPSLGRNSAAPQLVDAVSRAISGIL